MIDWQQRSWQRTPLYTDRTVQLSPAKIMCILRFGIVYGQDESKSQELLEGENRMVYEFIPMSRIGLNRRWADGVRVANCPRIHYIRDCRRDPENDDWNAVWTWGIYRTNHLHVNEQWHCMGRKGKQRIMYLRIPKPWQDMQEDSHTGIGRFSGLDQKRNGTELTRTSRMENGTMSLKTWWSTSVKADIRVPWIQCFRTRIFAKQRGVKLSKHFWGDADTVGVDLRTIISVNQLSVYGAVADMCGELASRISDCSESVGRLVAEDKIRDHGSTNRFVDNDQTTSDQWDGARRFAARVWTKIRKSSRFFSIDQTVLQCKFHKYCC